VRTVCIEGRIVMRNRRLLTLDEESIKARARVFRERILKSLAGLRRTQSENVFARVD
jgi:hypothetical protein